MSLQFLYRIDTVYALGFATADVREYFKKKKGLSDKQIDEQILSPYKDSELTNYTEFDRESIMMYAPPFTPFVCVLITSVRATDTLCPRQ